MSLLQRVWLSTWHATIVFGMHDTALKRSTTDNPLYGFICKSIPLYINRIHIVVPKHMHTIVQYEPWLLYTYSSIVVPKHMHT